MMALSILRYVQNLWPFSLLKHDDLGVSDRLVKELSVPDETKQFVFAVQEPESGAVMYILCAQNLSEKSASDADCLIRSVRPQAVVAQVNENQTMEVEMVSDRAFDYPVPTSSFEVIRRCFLHKTSKEKYENLAGSLVLRDIFGVGFLEHFLAAKKAAEEVGSSFMLIESPLMKSGAEKSNQHRYDSVNDFQAFALQSTSLVPSKFGSVLPSASKRSIVTNDVSPQMFESLSSYLVHSSFSPDAGSGNIQPSVDYEAPKFAQSLYPLLLDLHSIFINLPFIGRALAHAQKMLHDVNNGETVDGHLLCEVYMFRIAVEGLRIALTSAGRIPVSKMGNQPLLETEFSGLSMEEKSHAILARALQSQMSKFKSVVAVVDASSLAGLRKYWNTPIPIEIKDMIEQLVSDHTKDGDIHNGSDRKLSITNKPIVAVGAGATVVIGASSLSKAVPASTFVKVVTLKVPGSLKLVMTQAQRVFTIAISKILGPSKVVVSSGVQGTSALKATASAEQIRVVVHSFIASAEKTSLSAMRTAFYEIMRKRRVRPFQILPWATFGCSVATCASLLVYGDGIECAVESLPSAPSIANLGRGIQSLQQASQVVRQTESFRVQKSIDFLMERFKRWNAQ